MPSIPFDIDDLDLYEILEIDKESSSSQIKKAYRLAALKYHPDKASSDEEKENFHDKFQKIVFAYGVLSDDKKRSRYDKTGSLEDYNDDDEQSLGEMFEELYQSGISKEMVEEDKKNYQNSQEEIDDIFEAFEEGEGSMDYIFESIPHSSVLDDEERFVKIINDNVTDKSSKAYKNFSKETKRSKKSRKTRAEKEAKEAEELSKQLGLDDSKKGGNDEDALALMIQKRQQNRMDSLIGSIEEKYTKKSKKSTSDGPSEEDFERMKQRATKPKAKQSKVKKQ